MAGTRSARGGFLSFSSMLAIRFLRSSRSGALITRLSGMTSAGLGLGVAALILALSVLSGFQTNLLDDELTRSPQLVVEGLKLSDLSQLQETMAGLSGIKSVQKLSRGRGWLIDSDEFRPVELIAFEKSLPSWFPEASRAGSGLVDETSKSGLWLSDRRARAWALRTGDKVQIVSPRATLTPIGRPIPMRRQLTVVGTWQEGRDPETERAAGPWSLLGPLVGTGSTTLDVELEDSAMAEKVAEALRLRVAALEQAGTSGGQMTVKTWRDLNAGLLFVLRLEKALVFIAVFLIVMVASFALISALALILSAKQGEIGVLSAMGARPQALRAAFFQLGLLLTLAGASAGAALGISLAFILDRFELVHLPQGIYIVDYLPFLIRPFDLAVVLVACFGFATLSSIWAARRVGRLNPIEAIRR